MAECWSGFELLARHRAGARHRARGQHPRRHPRRYDRPEQMRDIERRMALERAHGMEVLRSDRHEELRDGALCRAGSGLGGCFCPIEEQGQSAEDRRRLRAARRGARGRVPSAHRAGLALEETGGGFLATTSTGAIEARRVVNCAGALAGKIAGDDRHRRRDQGLSDPGQRHRGRRANRAASGLCGGPSHSP